jgi:hypothetical protein
MAAVSAAASLLNSLEAGPLPPSFLHQRSPLDPQILLHPSALPELPSSPSSTSARAASASPWRRPSPPFQAFPAVALRLNGCGVSSRARWCHQIGRSWPGPAGPLAVSLPAPSLLHGRNRGEREEGDERPVRPASWPGGPRPPTRPHLSATRALTPPLPSWISGNTFC